MEESIQREEKFVEPCDAYYNIFTDNYDPTYAYRFLSPFEFKNTLIKLALKKAGSAKNMLNAGRGNPNFFSVVPRQAFSIVNSISTKIGNDECKDNPQLGFMPEMKGIARKFKTQLRKRRASPAKKFLTESIPKMQRITGMSEDALIHNLVISTIGCFYPEPPRVQPFLEPILVKFCEKNVYRSKKSYKGKVDVFPTEGATAAIIYIFNSLKYNALVIPGDKIGILTPIFSPYLEIPTLRNYDLSQICIQADEKENWEIPDDQLEKIADPNMKAIFMVNPTNPTAMSLSKRSVAKIKSIVRTSNPDLLVITDNVYAPFCDEYNTLFNELPQNTIGVYSLSKYFGVTGWRLGNVLMHRNNVIDSKLLKLVDPSVHSRYSMISTHPDKVKFIDRMVADSRQIAEAHTAGLSTPQQAIIALFTMYDLMDKKRVYSNTLKNLLAERIYNLLTPLDYQLEEDGRNSNYYIIIDIIKAANNLGRDPNFGSYLLNHRDPLEFVFKLAKDYATVVLSGVGFGAPFWSIRVSLANLDTSDYILIGNNIRNLLQEYYDDYNQWVRYTRKHRLSSKSGKTPTSSPPHTDPVTVPTIKN